MKMLKNVLWTGINSCAEISSTRCQLQLCMKNDERTAPQNYRQVYPIHGRLPVLDISFSPECSQIHSGRYFAGSGAEDSRL